MGSFTDRASTERMPPTFGSVVEVITSVIRKRLNNLGVQDADKIALHHATQLTGAYLAAIAQDTNPTSLANAEYLPSMDYRRVREELKRALQTQNMVVDMGNRDSNFEIMAIENELKKAFPIREIER